MERWIVCFVSTRESSHCSFFCMRTRKEGEADYRHTRRKKKVTYARLLGNALRWAPEFFFRTSVRLIVGFLIEHKRLIVSGGKKCKLLFLFVWSHVEFFFHVCICLVIRGI
jgi:hypothetical protein